MPGLDGLFKYEKSPLGISEVTLPWVPGGGGITVQDRLRLFQPFIAYAAEYQNDPETRAHERMHASQRLQPDYPVAEVNQILAPWLSSTDAQTREYVQPAPAYEGPAYRFTRLEPPPEPPPKGAVVGDTPAEAWRQGRPYVASNWQADRKAAVKQQQDELNAYLDLVRRRNPQHAPMLEATIPDRLLREYVKSHPRPLPPVPEMKTQGLLETLQRAYAGGR